jgi:hypothetical protein
VYPEFGGPVDGGPSVQVPASKRTSTAPGAKSPCSMKRQTLPPRSITAGVLQGAKLDAPKPSSLSSSPSMMPFVSRLPTVAENATSRYVRSFVSSTLAGSSTGVAVWVPPVVAPP